MNYRLTKRLTALKEYADKYKTDWRKVKYISAFKNPILKRSSITSDYNRNNWYVDSLDDFAGNVLGDSHELARLDHTGWFADNFQDGLIKGCVLKIRSSKHLDEDGAHFIYLPATYCTGYDGATVYNDYYYSAKDAALSADSEAEILAENSREEDAKYQAGTEIDDLRIELHELNRSTLSLVKEIKETGKTLPQNICSALRSHITLAIKQRQAIFARIAQLQDNYWLSVE
jgi:hypothetical protein